MNNMNDIVKENDPEFERSIKAKRGVYDIIFCYRNASGRRA
jgi:hypothetical protein